MRTVPIDVFMNYCRLLRCLGSKVDGHSSIQAVENATDQRCRLYAATPCSSVDVA